MAIRHGTTVKEIFWALGQYDAVVVVEAQDEMAMTAVGRRRGRQRPHANSALVLAIDLNTRIALVDHDGTS
jgi:uncharacterized protein with GYD domain